MSGVALGSRLFAVCGPDSSLVAKEATTAYASHGVAQKREGQIIIRGTHHVIMQEITHTTGRPGGEVTNHTDTRVQ